MSNVLVSDAAFSRVIRAGDSTSFNIKLRTERDAILRDCIEQALSGAVHFEPNFRTMIRQKVCISIPHYSSQLVLRSISRFLMRRLRIKLPNRDIITSEVIQALTDRTPMHIIRRDIKSFYESISAADLRAKLEFNSAIPELGRKYITRYFEKFCNGSGYGLPRGIGLSAVLVEYAMQDFDKRVQEIAGVYRFYRYCDDMLIFCFSDPVPIVMEITKLLAKTSDKFEFNEEKSTLVSLVNIDKNKKTTKGFDYLGYHFHVEDITGVNKPRRVDVSIADSKISKLKTKVVLSFKDYKRTSNYSLFRDRLKYISGNYRVPRGGVAAMRDSLFIKSGIFYSHRLCGSYAGMEREHLPRAELRALDNFFQYLVGGKKSPFSALLFERLNSNEISELRQISFRKGHELKFFVRFEAERLDEVKRIWRNV